MKFIKGLIVIMAISKKTKKIKNSNENFNRFDNNIDLKKVESIVRGNERIDLGIKFAKKDLDKMFMCIFGEKPLSKMKKDDVAYSLWNHFHHIDRAKSILGR